MWDGSTIASWQKSAAPPQLTTRHLKSLCYPLEEREVAMDKLICKQDRFATHVFFVKRGECNVFKSILYKGKLTTMSLGRLCPGGAFGLMRSQMSPCRLRKSRPLRDTRPYPRLHFCAD